jgi:hypothetical protein
VFRGWLLRAIVAPLSTDVTMKKVLTVLLLIATAAAVSRWASAEDRPIADGPRYTSGNELVRPADYRDWVYVTTGLGMTYGAASATGQAPIFDNVFVNRESHRQFMATGRWPDKTIFILELRRAETQVSINNGGHTQGEVVAVEAAVKDRTRFPDTTWGYFDFGRAPALTASAAPLPTTARCYACHRDNTAVEQTFVQFYPTLFEVAKRVGTVKATYDPNHKVTDRH